MHGLRVPGGYVVVTRGMLSMLNSEDQLAALLAHEIAHIAARHAVERRLKFPGGDATDAVRLARSAYTREQEREADTLSVTYLAEAGYEPTAAIALIERVQRYAETEWMAGRLSDVGSTDVGRSLHTHPPTDERIERVAAAIAQLGPNRPTFPASELERTYLNQIDGMRHGPGFNEPMIWATTPEDAPLLRRGELVVQAIQAGEQAVSLSAKMAVDGDHLQRFLA